jgi:hypothetical protein
MSKRGMQELMGSADLEENIEKFALYKVSLEE